MNVSKQIEILRELIEGVEELNGEHEEGWYYAIEKGKEMLKHLKETKTTGSIKSYIVCSYANVGRHNIKMYYIGKNTFVHEKQYAEVYNEKPDLTKISVADGFSSPFIEELE